MKPLTLAVHSLAAASLLALGAACTSDTNPFDVETPTTTTSEKTATIRLEFNVAETRAGLTTSEEEKFSYVSIYVFDENGNFEKSVPYHDISKGNPTVDVPVGIKTVYAITGTTLQLTSANLATIGLTTIDAFETIIFDSQVSNIAKKDAFMMIGKSDTKSVYYTVEGAAVPATNVFSIELVRMVAKTQVKLASTINTSAFGFNIVGTSKFKVAQTCDRMRIKPNDNDVINNYQSANNGSFIGYTAKFNDDPAWIYSGAFTADNCKYMPENIVTNHTTGNTTFVVLSVPFVPTSYYTYDYNGNLSKSSATPASGLTFYTVAIVDESYGYEDFTIDPITKQVYAFQHKDDADRYAAALNGGVASAMTVAEDDAPMRAPGTRAGNNFQVATFNGGDAYYRINIKDGDEYKVDRNKYYKITVNSIKSLGCHSEDLLRPTDPNTALDSKPTGSAMIGATFKVKDWDEVNQSADID